jgi:hypothetical protein
LNEENSGAVSVPAAGGRCYQVAGKVYQHEKRRQQRKRRVMRRTGKVLAVYFLLGGNKVFQFCHAMVGGIGVGGIVVVCSACVVRIVAVCVVMMRCGHTHHGAMMMMGNGGNATSRKAAKATDSMDILPFNANV